jgi:TRAP-type C4-dicarboxylate transport system permease small subunit
MRRIEQIVAGAANFLAVAGLTMLLVLATFTLFDGLLRALVNYPLDVVREVGDLVAAVSGACCLPVALLHRSNITLRIFEKFLPAGGTRAVDVLADVVILIVMVGMAWQFGLFGVKTLQAHDVTWLMNVPKAPFWFVVDAILWVAAAVQAWVLMQACIGVRIARFEETAL